jgi:hypothetical protein
MEVIRLLRLNFGGDVLHHAQVHPFTARIGLHHRDLEASDELSAILAYVALGDLIVV